MYIPSQEMGDYEEARNRTRKKSGALFPLDEEGCYGRPPAQQAQQARQLPAPLPGYLKRERKPKVYASYAVSNDCCMHAQKLEKNETAKTSRGGRRETPPSRGRTPPTHAAEPAGQPRSKSASQPAGPPAALRRKDSGRRASDRPRHEQQQQPAAATAAPRKTKWQNTLRETSQPPPPARWQDSLRGRDSISPSTPRLQRRPSTRLRPAGRRTSTSTSPNRDRTVSASPDRRRQSTSSERGGRLGSVDRADRGDRGDRGDSTSTDWGYTDFSTFTANRKSLDHSSSSAERKFSSERKSSMMSDRRESSVQQGRAMTKRDSVAARKESSTGRRESSTGRRESSSDAFQTVRSHDASSSAQRKVSSSGLSAESGWRTDPANKISLGALKEASINEWDDLGILGLSSKMFKESNLQKEGFMSVSSASSSSYIRRESVTTKMM